MKHNFTILKKLFFIVLFTIFLCDSNNVLAQTNYQRIYDPSKQLYNQTITTMTYTINGVAIDGYCIAYSQKQITGNFTHYVLGILLLDNSYNVIKAGVLIPSDVFNPHNDSEIKITPRDVIQDSEGRFMVCGDIVWGKKFQCGFTMSIEPNYLTQLNYRFHYYPKIKSLNSIVEAKAYKSGIEYVTCGELNPIKELTYGIVMKINRTFSTSGSGGSVIWAQRFFPNPNSDSSAEKGTILRQVIKINADLFATVGSTDIGKSLPEEDVIVATITQNGQVINNWIYGEPNPSQQNFFERGNTITIYKDHLIIGGLQIKSQGVPPPTNPTYQHALIFSIRTNDGVLDWQKRYDLYKNDYVFPEKIITSSDMKDVWLAGYLHAEGDQKTFNDGFLLNIDPLGVYEDLTLFGDVYSDYLYDLVESKQNKIVSAGYTENFHPTDKTQIYLVEKRIDPERCLDLKPKPDVFDLKLFKTDAMSEKIIIDSVCIDLKNLKQKFEDSVLCDASEHPCPNSPADCVVPSLILNTGYNPFTGSPVITGTKDPIWQLIGAPSNSGISVPRYADVLATFSAWDPAFLNSHYISGSQYPNTIAYNINGTPYKFIRTFCTCEGDSGWINIKMLVDNHAELYLNGAYLGQSDATCPTSNFHTPTIISKKVKLHPGVCDTLEVRVFDNGGYMGLDIEATISGAYFLKDSCCPCIDIGASVYGIKYWDKNNNGIFDGTDSYLNNWQITLYDAGNNQLAQTNTDANGYYQFTDLVPGNYTVCEDVVNPWNNTQPGGSCYSFNIADVFDSKEYNFGNYKLYEDCDINVILDTNCCCMHIKALNPPGSIDIASVSLAVTGGDIKSWDYYYCNPVQPPGSFIQTSNALWTYSPVCSSNLEGDVCFTSTTASGWIHTQWTINYTDGTICKYKDSIQCDRQPLLQCDSVTSYTFPDPNLDVIHRRITVINNKIPVSPICSIHVVYTPSTLPTSGNTTPTSGGELRLNNGPVIANRWIIPYNNIDLQGITPVINCNYGDNIAFNVGIDYHEGWAGTIKLYIYHCDGDTCESDVYDSTWYVQKARKGSVMISVADENNLKKDIWSTIVNIACKSKPVKIKSLAIYPLDDSKPANDINLFAISGSQYFSGDKPEGEFAITRQGTEVALFEFYPPRLMRDKNEKLTANLVYTGNAIPEDMKLVWVAFDENGNAIEGDTLTSKITNVPKIEDWLNNADELSILQAYPNPSAGNVSIEYSLLGNEIITIDLLDLNGRLIKALDQTYGVIGKNTVSLSLQDINSGEYFVRLRTTKGIEAISKIVIIQ